jgi:hypothetical protein
MTNPEVFLPNHIVSNNEYPDAKVTDKSRRTLMHCFSSLSDLKSLGGPPLDSVQRRFHQ